MPDERRCEKCGAVLATFGESALCPNCMLHEAVGLVTGPSSQSPIAGQSLGVVAPVTEASDERIGRYKLLQPIGEGGMGIVYMAEQEEPVRRRVALKVIKLGMDTKSVIARFEAERQALALMDHPNIAKVLDAGATDAGRPYFVMELVRGIRITDYCDQDHLTTQQRLDLFMQVCKAIQHAHQKGIIHRDIKPSNILVTLHDGVPVPKIIDFGIAKATSGQRLTNKTLFTALEQFLGTPAYMSPEQAEMSGLDIDTRSDIYCLGVLLYELLTGKPPFDANELLQAGLDEMRRKIREDEPRKPSTRLSTLGGAEAEEVTNRFKMSPMKLAALIRGDLDWVVMKALEKDRARRYDTANGLAMDIQRHLTNEPVLARPPSAAYRFRKMVRRNKLAFIAASAVIAALFIGLGISTWEFFKEKAALKRAVDAEKSQSQLRQQAETTGTRLAETLERMQIQMAEELFTTGDSSTALAYLARVLRQGPGNRVAAERLLSALSHRSYVLPTIEPIKHEASVQFALISPDGQRVVTASGNTVRVWNANTGRPLTDPFKHEGVVLSVQFSPDGQQVVTTSEDRTARIWDAITGRQLASPLKHERWVYSAQFSPDGHRVLTASGDNTARVWDANTGKPLSDPLKHEDQVLSVQFSPDGQWVVTASKDKTARIWNANTSEPLTEPLKHQGSVLAAQFSPDGLRIVTASEDRTARVWDAKTGQPLTDPFRHNTGVMSAKFGPDGQQVVTASADTTAQVWDTLTGAPFTAFLMEEGWINSALFSPDGQRVVTASDKTARIWDARTGKPLTEPLRHEEGVVSARFSPDGLRIVTASQDRTARIWDANPGQVLTDPLKHESPTYYAPFSPDGNRVLKSSLDGSGRIYEVATGKPLTEPFNHEVELSTPFSPDGLRIVTASQKRTARIWDANTGKPLTEPLKHEGLVFSAKFSPDGQRVVTASEDKAVRVWDANTGQLLTGPLLHESRVQLAQLSPDGQRVVTASEDKAVRVWDVNTGQLLTGPLLHESRVQLVEFSPDGQRIVTASEDKMVRVWDANTGWSLIPPIKQEAWILSVQFSPDGPRMVIASLSAVRVWDASTGQPLTEPLKHGFPTYSARSFRPDSARFSPDGQRVIVSESYYWTGNKTVWAWEIPSVSLPVPEWIPKLAETIAGKRFNDHGVVETVQFSELVGLKAQLAKISPVDVWTRCARWLFADPLSRTISPFSEMTVSDYVGYRVNENTLESLLEAVKLEPTNALALTGLTRAILAQKPAYPRQFGEALWFSLRAITFAPDKAEAWSARAEALVRCGNFSEALGAMARALKIQPRNPDFWNAQGQILKSTNQLDKAYESFTTAITLASSQPGSLTPVKFYMNRADCLRKQNRLAEAGDDVRLARNIPSRDPQAKSDQMDLTPYYNASLADKWHVSLSTNLDSLPRGLQTLAGVQFDVRGVVQVGGETPAGEQYPTQVLDIAIGKKCKRLHFLHSVVRTIEEGELDHPAIVVTHGYNGDEIGRYVIHFADGQQRALPLVLGQDLAYYWPQPDEEDKRLVVAWKGTHELSHLKGCFCTRLFKTTWENPVPGIAVKSIDFVSGMALPNPFLVAITVE